MKTFYEAIYEWVAENYGQSEADNPSWSIEALADHLSKTDIKPDELNAYTKSNVYSKVEQSYLEEDVENYARDHDYKLTDQQIGAVADKIRFSEWYCSINPEDMDYYIKRELEIAKEKVE